jgi:hypothetical protein
MEFDEIIQALEAFTITTQMIRTAGGNESDMPKVFSHPTRRGTFGGSGGPGGCFGSSR